MARMVLGIFSDYQDAEGAIRELEENGFEAKDISIIMRDHTQGQRLAEDTGGSNVAGGAVSGAATGGVLGGLAGLLIGLGVFTIPGLGALLIGGPIAVALGLGGAAASTVSGAVTGIVAGGVVGALIGLGVPEEEAKVYEERIREGGILVAVPTEAGYETEAMDILEGFRADQIRAVGFSVGSSGEAPIERAEERPSTFFHNIGRRKRRLPKV